MVFLKVVIPTIVVAALVAFFYTDDRAPIIIQEQLNDEYDFIIGSVIKFYMLMLK